MGKRRRRLRAGCPGPGATNALWRRRETAQLVFTRRPVHEARSRDRSEEPHRGRDGTATEHQLL